MNLFKIAPTLITMINFAGITNGVPVQLPGGSEIDLTQQCNFMLNQVIIDVGEQYDFQGTFLTEFYKHFVVEEFKSCAEMIEDMESQQDLEFPILTTLSSKVQPQGCGNNQYCAFLMPFILYSDVNSDYGYNVECRVECVPFNLVNNATPNEIIFEQDPPPLLLRNLLNPIQAPSPINVLTPVPAFAPVPASTPVPTPVPELAFEPRSIDIGEFEIPSPVSMEPAMVPTPQQDRGIDLDNEPETEEINSSIKKQFIITTFVISIIISIIM